MTPQRALRLYRLLLRMAPLRLRHRHGDEMTELFADALDDARRKGLPAWRVWVRATVDLLAARMSRPRPASTHLTVPIDERSTTMFGFADLRHAVRSLMRQRAATTLAAAMLSIGIAANVAVFTLIDGIFLRPFPFPQPDRLVYFNETAPKWNIDVVGINFSDFAAWRDNQRAFDAIGMYTTEAFNLTADGRTDRIRGLKVTYDFGRALGVTPLLGRTFTPQDDVPHGPNVVMISEGLWRTQFGSEPNVLGRALRLDDVSYTIVGVLPRTADFPDEGRVWLPLKGDPTTASQSFEGDGIGRLKAGVSADEGQRDLMRVQRGIWQKVEGERPVSPFVRPLREQFVRDFRTIAGTLFGSVAILLLVACANIASLMLARALARRREMGIRLALGASRRRLLRQLFTENLLLGVVGCGAGLGIGAWTVRLLVGSVPSEVPHWATFGIDWRIVAFAAGTMLVTVVVFGWAPALHALRGDLRSAVQATSTATTGSPRGRRTLWMLVGSEFALAALLLTCGGLLVQAFSRVRSVDPGFRVDHLLKFTVSIPEAKYDTEQKRLAFWTGATERFGAVPGVESTALITCAPLGCHWGMFPKIEGVAFAPDATVPVTLVTYASPNYFSVAGIRLRGGRFFTDADARPNAQRTVIVNETFARTFFSHDPTPLGHRIRLTTHEQWATIVGVAVDEKHYGLERPMIPQTYFAVPSSAGPTPDPNLPDFGVLAVLVRTRVEPASIVPAMRSALRDLDPELPMADVQTMETAVARSLSVRALYSWMLAVFAALALILAVAGAYGVSTYLVTQRTREIGIRVALGARTTDILRAVVGRGVSVVGIGVAAGLLTSLAAAKKMSSLLFGVNPHDAVILGSVAAILVITALLANTFPARRAARIDPMRSLRTE